MYPQRLLSPLACFGLLLALAAVWFGPLDYRYLIKPDEGRYAEIPLEMFLSGDWLTPRLNGVKYFEKPPLQYWATAVAYELFGVNEWTARLWTALTGFVTLLAVLLTGRRLFGANAGLLAMASLAAMPFMMLGSQMNTLDMGLTCFLTLALCGVLLSNDEQTSTHGARGWMLLTWVSLALAVLTKGLVALVLTGGTLVLYSLVSRDLSPWRRGRWLVGLVLFFAITAPWFVMVCQANPEFFNFFFIHEHFERFLSKVHRRYQPAWYFIPVLLGGALPWSFLYLQSWATAWRRDTGGGFKPRLFLTVWSVVVFGFFSVSSSKLPSYILPMVPALALLFGDSVPRLSRRNLQINFAVMGLLALAGLLYSPSITQFAGEYITEAMLKDYSYWVMGACALILAGAIASLLLLRKDRLQEAIIALAVASVPGWALTVNGNQTMGHSTSGAEVVAAVKADIPADAPFYILENFDQTIPFYLGRPVTLVAMQDELAFGLEQEPWRWVPDMTQFRARWKAESPVFAVMPPDRYEALKAEGLPMELMARDTRRMIVKKP